MRTGAAWADVPSRYPSSSTCYRYFQAWVKAGAFVKILNTLANARVARSTWQYRRHVRASQKGALPSAKPNAAKGASSWQFLAFLSPFTYRVLRRMNPSSLSHAYFVADEPKRLIGDKAYDSDSLDAALAKRGIEMIAPHRSNRTAPKTQERSVVATLQAAMEG
jgi:hypothetical protein